MVSFTGLVLISTGSFLIWMFKGFKGKFDDHMVRLNDRHTLAGWTRFGIGLLFWVIAIFSVAGMLQSSKDEIILYYEITPDGKGGYKVK